MPFAAPDSWSAIDRSTIALDDILGAPGVKVGETVQRAAGAFGTDARQVAPRGSLFLLARRELTQGPLLRRGRAPVAEDPARLVNEVLPAADSETTDLRTVRTLRSASGEHVVMQQQLRGHDVVGGRVLVHADALGSYGVTGHPIGDLASRDPGPPPKEAHRKVAAAIREQFSVVPGARLGIRAVALPAGGDCQWAWFAKVPLADPVADVRVFLSAKDLSVLLVYPASVPALYGEASVFEGSPSRSKKPAPVCLRGLGPDPTDALQGAAVAVETGNGAAARRADRNFTIGEDDPSFDEGSAFFYATQALESYAALFPAELFAEPVFKPLRLIVHDAASVNNAFYHPDRGLVTLGDFAAGPTAARSADMVFHEIGHVVSHAVCRLCDTPSNQARGAGEGYSDYFACSFLDDPRFGDYVMNKPNGARNCAKPGLHVQGDPGTTERYALGEVWANVLWAIRAEVGRSIADSLVAESLYFGQGASRVVDFKAALVAADAALFPSRATARGRHADLIDEEFKRRFG